MVSTTKDLTKGTPWRLMVSFAMPLFLSQLFQQLYNTVDSLIVGRFLGTAALAAVTSASSLVYLLVNFFTGLSLGAGIIIARFFGAEDYENVNKAIHTDILFGFICGIALSVCGVIGTPVFLKWLRVDSSVIPLAKSYYTVYFSGSLAVVMYNICLGIMNSLGDSRRPLIYLIISSLLNIVLDYVLIVCFGFGVASASVATVISQMVSVVLCFIHLAGKNQVYTISLRKFRIHRDMLREMLRYGIPTGVTNCVIGLANTIIEACVNSFGMVTTAGFGAHSKIEGFGFLPITSFTMAISTFVSQNLGAQEYDRAKQGARFGIIASCICAQLIGLTLILTRRQLVGVFDPDPAVVEIGSRTIKIKNMFYFLLAFSHAIAAVCRGAGKAFVPMIIMLSVWCVFRISYIIVVMHLFKSFDMVVWAYPITWTISSIIYLIYYKKSDWVHGFEN